jgi:hypothetical protein
VRKLLLDSRADGLFPAVGVADRLPRLLHGQLPILDQLYQLGTQTCLVAAAVQNSWDMFDFRLTRCLHWGTLYWFRRQRGLVVR